MSNKHIDSEVKWSERIYLERVAHLLKENDRFEMVTVNSCRLSLQTEKKTRRMSDRKALCLFRICMPIFCSFDQDLLFAALRSIPNTLLKN